LDAVPVAAQKIKGRAHQGVQRLFASGADILGGFERTARINGHGVTSMVCLLWADMS
jgi:hypothetical protein